MLLAISPSRWLVLLQDGSSRLPGTWTSSLPPQLQVIGLECASQCSPTVRPAMSSTPSTGCPSQMGNLFSVPSGVLVALTSRRRGSRWRGRAGSHVWAVVEPVLYLSQRQIVLQSLDTRISPRRPSHSSSTREQSGNSPRLDNLVTGQVKSLWGYLASTQFPSFSSPSRWVNPILLSSPPCSPVNHQAYLDTYILSFSPSPIQSSYIFTYETGYVERENLVRGETKRTGLQIQGQRLLNDGIALAGSNQRHPGFPGPSPLAGSKVSLAMRVTRSSRASLNPVMSKSAHGLVSDNHDACVRSRLHRSPSPGAFCTRSGAVLITARFVLAVRSLCPRVS